MSAHKEQETAAQDAAVRLFKEGSLDQFGDVVGKEIDDMAGIAPRMMLGLISGGKIVALERKSSGGGKKGAH